MNKIVGKTQNTLRNDQNFPDVKYIRFENEEEEKALLEAEIKAILAGGVKAESITILSPYWRRDSVVSKITTYKISEVGVDACGITFSTIQGFKGLENAIILLVDIKSYSSPDLMYVGMSRARSALYVFENDYAIKYRKDLIGGKR